MRSLQYLLFLGLFGLPLATGCTITTTDDLGKAGAGGEDGGSTSASTGGKTSAGGTSSKGGGTATGGSGVAGATTAAPVFAAADCPAAAATAPAAAYADVTSTCINCLYTTGCAKAVVCRNSGTCMTETLKALECIRLNFLYNESTAIDDSVLDCQSGGWTAANVPTTGNTSHVTVTSTDPKAWFGSQEVPEPGTDLLSECWTECNLTN